MAKYYFNIDLNGKIIGRAINDCPSYFENIQEVDKKIWDLSYEKNHNFLSEDRKTTYYKEIDERTDEEKKQSKIQEINSKAYTDITAKYPLWKQSNITRMKDYNEVTLAEYETMTTFIDEIRAWADYEVMKI
ncbi:MAG: hypothetical protein JW924_12015 [Fusobacteriaceae bacterium]|nr:hypothetical protein [Fusobacteriaceae bacterium]